jgi:hypothetical protein
MLKRAAEATRTASQGMSSAELAAAAKTTPGAAQYSLLGVDQFSPAGRAGSRVAVNGVLIPREGGAAINVTSMYTTQSVCR